VRHTEQQRPPAAASPADYWVLVHSGGEPRTDRVRAEAASSNCTSRRGSRARRRTVAILLAAADGAKVTALARRGVDIDLRAQGKFGWRRHLG
jgi:hypothetical protein